MIASLIKIKGCSSPDFWYQFQIGQECWATLELIPDDEEDNDPGLYYYRLVTDCTKLFNTYHKGIDYDIVQEADIDLVIAVRVNSIISNHDVIVNTVLHIPDCNGEV